MSCPLDTPLVTVVIPCYNHGHYLSEAIESVLRQSYAPVEILVVDDGSVDNTAQVAAWYPQVRYIHQQNQGLSAARNTGIRHSQGEMLVFLDADDWLYPDAIATNVQYLQQNPQLAFVSGAYDNVFNDKKGTVLSGCQCEISSDYYLHLLDYNYVGMIAAVLFRRWIFNEYLFDILLRGSEDHDLYLKIARNYKVVHHQKIIAAYRRHEANMSSNVPSMVANALIVLKKQKEYLTTQQESKIYNRSYRSLYKQYFLAKPPFRGADHAVFKEDGATLYFYKVLVFLKRTKQIKAMQVISDVKKSTSSEILKNILNSQYLRRRKVNAGDLNRLTPLSNQFGYDRGGPIDRYYIEKFLQIESKYIKGRVLEIGDNAYTIGFGGDKVVQSDIFHVDESNKAATFIGDISNAPQIPDNAFDCIVLTQTLHLIYNYKEALQTCYRILKPGGCLLLTVPGITPISHDVWKETWYWSFTDKAMKKLMAETFPGGDVEVNAFGNVFVATAFLYGMGLPEVTVDKLDYYDQDFQIIISVKAIKK